MSPRAAYDSGFEEEWKEASSSRGSKQADQHARWVSRTFGRALGVQQLMQGDQIGAEDSTGRLPPHVSLVDVISNLFPTGNV